MKKYLASLFICSVLCGAEPISRDQIPYLLERNDFQLSFQLYQQHKEQNGRHDFEVLESIGTILLEKGARSPDPQIQLLTLYGSAYASRSSMLPILEEAVLSKHLETQLAAIHLLGRIEDDRSTAILLKAFSSDFLYARMEAALQLSHKRVPAAAGQIEALMYRLPPQLRFYFPQLFSLIGTTDSVRMLKTLLDDANEQVRIETILCSAQTQRDDLLPLIRKLATHAHLGQQEAAAFALGELHDSSSIPQLKRLAASADSNVKIAALRSLILLGDSEAKEALMQQGRAENLFAIAALGSIEGSEETLSSLLDSKQRAVQINAAFALLQRRDPRALPLIQEIILHENYEWGFIPGLTPGRSLQAWKPLSAGGQRPEMSKSDLAALGISIREWLLEQSLELPEDSFLSLASALLHSSQTELIPKTVSLLEKGGTEKMVRLLKKESQHAGAPLLRAYCNLALYRLNESGPYEQEVVGWLKKNMSKELIRFRSFSPSRSAREPTHFSLTPREESRLLIEACEALAHSHNERAIDLILEMILKGNPKNRFTLAGLLLQTIQ